MKFGFKTTMRRWRTLFVMIRLFLVILALLLGIQIVLMMCHCSCRSLSEPSYIANTETHMGADVKCPNVSRADSQRLRQLEEKIMFYRARLRSTQRLEKFIISQEFGQTNTMENLNILKTYAARNEFDIIPYESFTSDSIFGEIGYQYRKPVSYFFGQKAVDHKEVLQYSIRRLNSDIESTSDKLSIQNFIEGIVRNDYVFGTVYDMYFTSNVPYVFKHIQIVRPFSNLETVGKPETIDTTKEWINLIVPLSGKLDSLELFLERFVDTCIRVEGKVYLTIVYFGKQGRDVVQAKITKIAKRERFTKYKIVFTDQEFSRGLGLQKGVEAWNDGNILMFFCDIDIFFYQDFLDRCRLHTSPGKKVYYPIVFSQYNPSIIYGGQEPPPLAQQMYLHKDSGFWRDFGYGMTCQYKSDFLKIGGFDLSIRGWGGEDNDLYKRYLQADISVVRAYDRGLFHIYHPKTCSKTLTDNQFVSCLQSKAVAEGSHKQLGMLAFGPNLISGKEPDWNQKLKESLNGVDALKPQDLTMESNEQSNSKGDSHIQNKGKPKLGKDNLPKREDSYIIRDSSKTPDPSFLLSESNRYKRLSEKLQTVMEELDNLKEPDVDIEDLAHHKDVVKLLQIKLSQRAEDYLLKGNQAIDGG